ncbi:hypothetical protein HanIR_Chr08g0385701 [Helianthus annuus]|nr:hypothetical protein HanIR_Chr08g0385701 [Helianthus annuus]
MVFGGGNRAPEVWLRSPVFIEKERNREGEQTSYMSVFVYSLGFSQMRSERRRKTRWDCVRVWSEVSHLNTTIYT